MVKIPEGQVLEGDHMDNLSLLDTHLREKIKQAACLAAATAKKKMCTNKLTRNFEEKSCDKEAEKTSS